MDFFCCLWFWYETQSVSLLNWRLTLLVFFRCLCCLLIRYERLVGLGFRFSLLILYWRDQLVLTQLVRSACRYLRQVTIRQARTPHHVESAYQLSQSGWKNAGTFSQELRRGSRCFLASRWEVWNISTATQLSTLTTNVRSPHALTGELNSQNYRATRGSPTISPGLVANVWIWVHRQKRLDWIWGMHPRWSLGSG